MLDAVALELMAVRPVVRPDLTSAWGGIEVASDGHPAHFYFYDFCIDSPSFTKADWLRTSMCIVKSTLRACKYLYIMV